MTHQAHLGAMRVLRAADKRRRGWRMWWITETMHMSYHTHYGWCLESYDGVSDDWHGVDLDRASARIVLRGMFGGCPCCDAYWYPPEGEQQDG